jgi:hypothetical protein
MAEKITDEFKQMVASYIEVCDKLAENNKKIKSMKDEKKLLETQIKEYMIDAELFNLDLNKAGSLNITTTKKVKKLNKQDIHDVLLETIKEDDIRAEIIDKAFPESDEEVTKLQRKKAK